MPRLVLAPEARQDLREIRDHIAKDDPKAARRVVTRLRDLARVLAGAPAMGRDRPELGAQIRSFVADRYLLFYRPLRPAAGIEIVRVLHDARDIDAVLSGTVIVPRAKR
jgi:toxin ParE1/3/4